MRLLVYVQYVQDRNKGSLCVYGDVPLLAGDGCHLFSPHLLHLHAFTDGFIVIL